MKKINFQILGLLAIVSFSLKAQTTNTGLITVEPDTQFSVVDEFTNSTTASVINGGETFFYSDVINSGTLDYLGTTGLVRLNGVNQQSIIATEPIFSYNLVLDNNSGLEDAITLTGNLNVKNQIDFTQGILNTIDNNGEFVLQNGSTTINESDNSFVDGFVTKEGNDSFEFPIGDSEFYRYAAISAPTNINAEYKARYVYQDQDNTYPAEFRIGNVVLINENEYWIVENTQGSEEIDVTLSWDEASTTPNNIITNPAAIRMARWDFEQGAWRDAGGLVDTVNRTVTSTQTIDDIAVFTIAGADLNIVLPDDVIVWNAVSPNNNGKNDYFLIEGIENLPNNSVEIYNRWGAKIFSTRNYDTSGNVFNGFANGRTDKLVPSGTYFYILKYDTSLGQGVEKAGFLYVTTD